jgi:hypothetical protein
MIHRHLLKKDGGLFEKHGHLFEKHHRLFRKDGRLFWDHRWELVLEEGWVVGVMPLRIG